MSRTHYTKKPLSELREIEQPDTRESMKPRGLWYGVDGEWEEWCASEMPDWIKGGLLYAIKLGNEKLLRINSVEELDAFAESFQSNPFGLRVASGIDWRAVAKEWDGIEIDPYQYERRLSESFLWYYGWDCASGVIWRPRGLTFELVRDDRQLPAQA